MSPGIFDSVETARVFLRRQSRLTEPMRKNLLRRVGIGRMDSVLDAGCGTGEISEELRLMSKGRVVGVDFDPGLIRVAAESFPSVEFVCADCMSMPFESGAFEMVFCHFFLMWAEEQERVVDEFVRVLKRGGVILCSAEPDYAGIIEYPENVEFRSAERAALERKGADASTGRKLYSLFLGKGLAVEVGVFTSVLKGESLKEQVLFMRDMYIKDFLGLMSREDAEGLIDRELDMISRGKVVVTPIFWALCRKPWQPPSVV